MIEAEAAPGQETASASAAAPAVGTAAAPTRRPPAVRWALIGLAALLVLLAAGWGPTLAAGALRAGETAALRALGHALVVVDPPPDHADAVAVHGGGGPLRQRERPAVALLDAGRADAIVAMGGPLPPGDPDITYAGATVRRLRELDVGVESIVRLDEGLSTRGELRALRRLAEARGWQRLTLSTSAWHTRRVSMVARRVFAGSNIAWTVIALPESDVNLDHWWREPFGRGAIIGEWMKIAMMKLTE